MSSSKESVTTTDTNVLFNSPILQLYAAPKININIQTPLSPQLLELNSKVQSEIELLQKINVRTNKLDDYLSNLEINLLAMAEEFINMCVQQNSEMNIDQFALYKTWLANTQTFAVYKFAISATRTTLTSYLTRYDEIINNYIQNVDNLDDIILDPRDRKATEASKQKFFEYEKSSNNVNFNNLLANQNLSFELQNFLNTRIFANKYSFILFTGPPGTGKSTFATAMATAWNAKLFLLNIPQMSSNVIGETEKMLTDLFEYANNNPQQNFIIFFDEIDLIVNEQSNLPHYMKTIAITLQTILEGGQVKLGKNILVIGATNFKNTIRKAILDRTSAIFFFDLPNEEDATKIFSRLIWGEVIVIAQMLGVTIVNQELNKLFKKDIEIYSRILVDVLNYIKQNHGTIRNIERIYENAIQNKYTTQEAMDFVVFIYNGVLHMYELINTNIQNTFSDATLDELPTDAYVFYKKTVHDLIRIKQKIPSTLIFLKPTQQNYEYAIQKVQFMSDAEYQKFKQDNEITR